MSWTDPNRWQLWSCGGGVQSTAIAALIIRGELPKPDRAVMVDTNRERQATWGYLEANTRPGLASVGVDLEVIDRSKYATVDIWTGQDGQKTVLPVYSTLGENGAKFQEYCSGEWKRDVVMRWANEQGLKDRDVSNWLGISTDEAGRRRGPRRQWFQPVYPLLDCRPTTRTACYEIIRQHGWPEPPRSRCWMCPNQGNAEWRETRENPEEFEAACKLDELLRTKDPDVYVHKSRVPLRLADLGTDDGGLFTGGCSAGMCY